MNLLEQAVLLTDLLQKVGYALWQLAELEDAAASYFAVRLRPVRGVGREASQPILDASQKKTFGRLVNELEKAGALDSVLSQDLQRLVKERNWLVHRAKRENRGAINRPETYASLVARLDRLAEDASAVLKRLVSAVEAYVQSSGVPIETIEVEAARLRQAWGYE